MKVKQPKRSDVSLCMKKIQGLELYRKTICMTTINDMYIYIYTICTKFKGAAIPKICHKS